jgi:hypothetical protein
MGANVAVRVTLPSSRSLNPGLRSLKCACKIERNLDPLDRELLERAFEGAWVVVKENEAFVDLESDEALEATLRRELIEIACSQGASDPETLRDAVLRVLSDRRT